jgi:hypothetical protein
LSESSGIEEIQKLRTIKPKIVAGIGNNQNFNLPQDIGSASNRSLIYDIFFIINYK